LLFVIGIFSFGHWVQVSEVPFPGDRALLVTAGYGFGLVGTVVVHAAATRLWSAVAAPRPWSRELAAVVGGVMGVVVAAGTVVAVAGEQSRVDATTSAAVQAPATAADPARVLWRWSAGAPARPSSRALIRDSVAAGAGVVVATGDGIVALDGRTGQERWHYRLTDTRYYPDLVAVDGGRGVVVSFDGRLHAFDAYTGELRWRDDEATARTPPHWDTLIAATDSTVVRRRYGPAQFAGTDVRTGEVRWQYTLPTLPNQCGDRARAHSIRDTVIIHNELCSDFVELTALDGATGELLWRKSPLPYDIDVRAGMILGESADVRLQFDARSGQESRVGTDDMVLASDSGELITDRGSLYEVGAAEPRWQLPGLTPPVGDDHWNTCAATFLGDAAVLLDFRDHG
ncbi:MAG: PQQ-binding-like beta-propeller repeat protein, partial [Stackebrandtia sp.]